MQRGPMHHHWMQWILCSMAQGIPIECSEFNAACPKSPRLNAVDSMPRDCLQLIPCSMAQCSRLNAVVEMKHDWMQWIPCSMIECRGFHAVWCNGCRWNAVDSMQHGVKDPDGMQWIICSMIECSKFHAAWLNAVDFMQHGPMLPNWMQWIPCSMI